MPLLHLHWKLRVCASLVDWMISQHTEQHEWEDQKGGSWNSSINVNSICRCNNEPRKGFWMVHSFWTEMSFASDRHSGYFSSKKNSESVTQVHDLTWNNGRLTICKVDEVVGLLYGLCQTILTEDFGMRHIPVMWNTTYISCLNVQKPVKAS
jgi:hypothetical protein